MNFLKKICNKKLALRNTLNTVLLGCDNADKPAVPSKNNNY